MSPRCTSAGELSVPTFSSSRGGVRPALATRSPGPPVVGETCATKLFANMSLLWPRAIYAGQAWNPGLKWRLIGGATVAVSIVPAAGFAFSNNTAGTALFGLLVLGGGITYIGATIAEIASAPGAARRHNERLDEGESIPIAPIIGREPGLAIGGRF